jgi:hypothetical protein
VRGWGERLAQRTGLHPAAWQRTDWYVESAQERREEELWRMRVGVDAARSMRAAAPDDFTARVMARIAAEQMASAPAPRLAVGPMRVVAGAIGVSAILALTSSCALAILAPSQALALLGGVLSLGVLLLTVLREVFSVATSTAAGSGALLVLAALPLLGLILAAGLARGDGNAVGEL